MSPGQLINVPIHDWETKEQVLIKKAHELLTDAEIIVGGDEDITEWLIAAKEYLDNQ